MARSKPIEAPAKEPDGDDQTLPFPPDEGAPPGGDGPDEPDEAATPPATAAAPSPGKKGKKAAEPKAMPGLIEGRVVHFVLARGKATGQHRAAIVSYVHDHGAGLVNLHVLLNGDMDFDHHEHPGNTYFLSKVQFSETPKPGTWHWIERSEP